MDLLIEIDQIYIEKDRFYIEIKIVDWDLSLDFELDRNRQSKSAVLKSELSTIRFVRPNRISLVCGDLGNNLFYVVVKKVVVHLTHVSSGTFTLFIAGIFLMLFSPNNFTLF